MQIFNHESSESGLPCGRPCRIFLLSMSGQSGALEDIYSTSDPASLLLFPCKCSLESLSSWIIFSRIPLSLSIVAISGRLSWFRSNTFSHSQLWLSQQTLPSAFGRPGMKRTMVEKFANRQAPNRGGKKGSLMRAPEELKGKDWKTVLKWRVGCTGPCVPGRPSKKASGGFAKEIALECWWTKVPRGPVEIETFLRAKAWHAQKHSGGMKE